MQYGSNEPSSFTNPNLGPGIDVNVAVHPPKGSPAEVGDLSASNLPLISIPHPARIPDDPAKAMELFEIELFRHLTVSTQDLYLYYTELVELELLV